MIKTTQNRRNWKEGGKGHGDANIDKRMGEWAMAEVK